MPRLTKSIFEVVETPYFRPGWRNALALAGVLGRGAEQAGQVEVELRQHQDRDQDRAAHEQDGLDDLHPGGALHAADGDVEDHQQADADDGPGLDGLVGDAEQQGDERTRADHLGQQVEDRDDDGRGGRGRPHGALPHPVRQLVGHRVAAGVPQQLGHQQQRDEPGDEEADGVEEPVVPAQGDGAGDAEERRRGHVVARDGHAVLEAAERAAAGVVVRRAVGLAARPEGDPDRDEDDGDEEDRGQGVGAHRPDTSCAVLGLEVTGQRVDLGRHVARVQPGDQEGGDELEEPEDEAPR